MIGFVTWQPLGTKKGGQVTKLIILVIIYYKLLYVIQGVENSFGKVTSYVFGCTWLFAMLLLIGFALFKPQMFLFSISILFVNKYHYFVEEYKQMLL